MKEFIKDQEQLSDFLIIKGADSFFIDNFHYHDFLNCISDKRKIIKEGVSSKVIEEYYTILNELSNFMYKFSSIYNSLYIADLTVKSSDEYINVLCEFRGSVYIINFEFDYKRNEGEWKICDLFFKREINFCHGLIVADEDDEEEFYSICCLVVGTDETDDVNAYIKDDNIMEIINNGIRDQLKVMSNGFSKIADDFSHSIREFM